MAASCKLIIVFLNMRHYPKQWKAPDQSDINKQEGNFVAVVLKKSKFNPLNVLFVIKITSFPKLQIFSSNLYITPDRKFCQQIFYQKCLTQVFYQVL